MFYPQKGLLEKVLEGAALFALACWLVRTGVCMIQSVWGWIILLSVIAGIVVVAIRLYKHHRDSQF